MSNTSKRFFAIASPVIVLVISIGIFARYAEDAGSEMIVAAVLIGLLALYGVGVSLYALRVRRAGMRAAIDLSESSPGSVAVLTEFDRKAARAMRRLTRSLGQEFKPGLLVAMIAPDRVSFFRPAGLTAVGTLIVGVDIQRYFVTMINRGIPVDEPCLRLVFLNGESIDAILYDASSGKWPREADLRSITSNV